MNSEKVNIISASGDLFTTNELQTINNSIATKLNISAKATNEQAIAGTDDTTYMTPLQTKAVTDNNSKVRHWKLNYGSKTTTNISLSNYITSVTSKICFTIQRQGGYVQLGGSSGSGGYIGGTSSKVTMNSISAQNSGYMLSLFPNTTGMTYNVVEIYPATGVIFFHGNGGDSNNTITVGSATYKNISTATMKVSSTATLIIDIIAFEG